MDPNDVYGVYTTDENGNEVMKAEQAIPQEDLCIAFNLTVQNFSRFKESSGNLNNFTISWSSAPSQNYQASFMAGTDFGKSKYDGNGTLIYQAPRYLTTYYTDISFDNYGSKQIVEGLGVSSVEVSWESWYTPTVVIKFVDVRGSAIWGNEEAIHENGKVTADNVFGCFFTQPYPIFTLLMKGFLGKAVSYQLTLSDFRGEYNSSTGDFEATATFIGYTYALLTDIPLEYLLAAPYCDYVGRAYWEQHCNDPAWQLDDGKAPLKLEEFYNLVKGAKPEAVDGLTAITDEESNELTNIANKRETLRALRNNLQEFINNITTASESYIDNTERGESVNKRQVVLMYSGETQTVPNGAKTAYNKLRATLEEYNSCFTDSAIPTDALPNGWRNCPDSLTATHLFVINADAGTNTTTVRLYGNSGRTATLKNIQALKLNDKRKLITPIARQIYDVIHERTANKGVLREYVYIIDINGLGSRIDAQLDILRVQEENTQQKVNNRLAEDVEKIVHFKPFIGNFFRTLMCHLETFIQIMYSACKEIESQAVNGLRSPNYLGITMDETDIPVGRCDYIVPWPKVINHGVTSGDAGSTDSARSVIGWVGDFSHNFTEEKVVLALEGAIRKIQESYENTATENESHIVPLVPIDFNMETAPYESIAGDLNPSSLAGYAGIRAFQVLGVFCDGSVRSKYAKLLGKMDAYNLYYSATSSTLRNQVMNQLGKGANGTSLMEIALCNRDYDDVANTEEGSGTKRHSFETDAKIAYSQSGRHPVIASDGSEYAFAHYYDKNKTSLIPSRLKKWTSYASDFKYVSAANYGSCYYQVISSSDYQWMTCASTYNVVGSDKSYVNKAMFDVITDTERVKSALDVYGLLSGGSMQVANATLEDNFSDLLNQFWLVTDKHFYGWFDKTNLSRTRSSLEVDETKLLPLDGKTSSSVSFTSNSKWLHNKNNVVNGSESGFVVSGSSEEYTINDLTIQSFDIWHCCDARGNLFGCPFYYMQNSISNAETRTYVKALLFLHSLKYDHNKMMNCFKSSKKSGSFEAVPYAYLLLVGGLLWRRRTHGETQSDPIVWSEGSVHFKECGYDHTLFVKGTDGKYRLTTIKSGQTTKNYNVSLKTVFGNIEFWEADYNIQNQLISLFKDFANTQFGTIRSKFEISSASKSPYTYAQCRADINNLSTLINKSGAVEAYNWLRSGIKGWQGVYRMVVPEQGEIFNMLLEETLDEVDTVKEIYTRECLVLDGCCRRLCESGDTDYYNEVKISKDCYSDYVSTLINTIGRILDTVKSSEVAEVASPSGSRKIEANRDICISIYKYCKNLWDKWLVPNKDSEEKMATYNVENFFDKNFLFIDSFYCNTYDKLPLNCATLLHLREGMENSGMLFSYIDHILSSHQCMFFSVPEFVGVSNDAMTSYDALCDMFRALPYNDMIKGDRMGEKESDVGRPQNKFVIIYVNQPSEIMGKGADYTSDCFDIWSRSRGTAEAPAIFSTARVGERYGNYYVPSFGVAVNRQNNHIFKSLKVSMVNPVMTEQAALALENVYRKGGEGERRIVFHGQDIYNIYSSYAYTCDIEMMGNAQVWPLMYFQLLNVPMWRGTYMIYKVTHSMTPGSMVTRFSGQKMSSTPMGFAQQFFSIKGEESSFDDYNYDSSGGYYSGEYPDMQESYKKVDKAQSDHYHDRRNWQTGKVETKAVSSRLVDLYNKLYEEIEKLDENGGEDANATKKWNVMITNVGTGSSTSDHPKGYAMDLTVMKYPSGVTSNMVSVNSKGEKKELLTALDILFCNHRSETRQVILEYRESEDMHDGRWYYLHVLHVAVKHDGEVTTNQYYIGSKDKKFGCINNGSKDDWFLQNVIPEFRKTASRCWFNDKNHFLTSFINYNRGKHDDETLTQHFSSDFSGTGTFSADMVHNIPIVMKILTNCFPTAIAKGICANMMRESELNPKAYNPNDNGRQSYGICQWNQGRVTKIISYAGGTYSKITDIPLEDQVRAAIKEMDTGDGGNVYAYFNHNKGISAEVASDYFMNKFERPAEDDETKNKRKNRGFIQQINQVWNSSS